MQSVDSDFSFPFEIYPTNWFQELKWGDYFPEFDRPLELDLGCGDGSFLTRLASHYPERNFVGVERLLGRVRKVSRKATRSGLENVRVIRIDSRYAVEKLFPAESFSRIHFLCPDPWPKKKHASRRQMCQLPFLRNLHRLLTSGGELIFKTDSEEYFTEATEVQNHCEFLAMIDWLDGDEFYPQSDFEEHWIAEGRSMHGMRLRKE